MKFKKYFSLIEFLFPLKDRRLILIGMLFLFLPTWVLAADFISLVGIPGVPDNGQDLNKYFNAIYRLSISLAALLAVVRIVLAGAKYMLTDIVPAKGEALEDIKGALLGLLIILGAVLILSTINYDLTHYNIKFDAVEEPPPPPPPDDLWQAFCDASGGCTNLSCDSIGEDIWNYISTGFLTGGTLGALGLISGPAGTITTFGGAFIGTAIGLGTYLAENTVSCRVACGWKHGKMIIEPDGLLQAGSCSIPNDAEAAQRIELESYAEELDTARKEEKIEIATASPILNSALESYFEVDSNYFNNLMVINYENEIVIADRGLVAMRLGLSNPGELSSNLSRVTQTAVYKTITFDQLQNPQSEYNIMLANAETQIRNSCSDGQISKMQVTENTQTSISFVSVLTRYYCLR